ncbi:phospholipase D-like domain-containing protein [Marinospirillum sp.]|uniref:phospholipase D-like domain-containing protein n=1 Tax=Marinospirillum sp. TaxID=2183934 RepID=UPI003A8871E8
MLKGLTWQPQQHFELISEAVNFYPRMLTDIAAAREVILLELYLLESGLVTHQWVEALSAASQRGVQVYLLIDGFGARGFAPEERAQLHHAGVVIREFNPLSWRQLSRNLVRNHRKLVLIDHHIAYVGGFGLADMWITPEHPWLDVALRIQGSCVTQWAQTFRHSWPSRPLPMALCPHQPIHWPTAALSAHNEGRVVTGWGLYRHTIKLSLLRQIHQARQQIWIATPYFAPSRRLRRALMKAAQAGVLVHLILPGPLTDHPAIRFAGQRFYPALLKAGVRILELEPRFIHAKVSLCDQWVSIGSCNFDYWGLRWNLEANQEARCPLLAQQVESWFQQAARESCWIDATLWAKRPWWIKIQERFWGWIGALVQRWH